MKKNKLAIKSTCIYFHHLITFQMSLIHVAHGTVPLRIQIRILLGENITTQQPIVTLAKENVAMTILVEQLNVTLLKTIPVFG